MITMTQITCPNCIALPAGENGVRPAEVGALAPVFKKSATKFKLKENLLTCKSTIQIATFNVRTLSRIGQLPELRASTMDHNIDIICIEEHRYLHRVDIKYHDTGNGWNFVSASAWKNSVNATIEGMGMLIGLRALKSVIRKYNRWWWLLHLMATPAPQSSSATALPILMKKQTSSPSMADGKTKWAEARVLRKLNWKLPAKKNEYTCGNNISRIYSENLRKLRMNQSQKLLVMNEMSN